MPQPYLNSLLAAAGLLLLSLHGQAQQQLVGQPTVAPLLGAQAGMPALRQPLRSPLVPAAPGGLRGSRPTAAPTASASLSQHGGPVAEAWVARYNGTVDGYDEGRAVAVDAAGDVYVTGVSAGAGGFGYATIKYDQRTGRQLWVARYSGPTGEDTPTAIALDAAGALYVTGYSANGRNYDYATVKYDQRTGRQLWVSRFTGPFNSSNYATGLALDAAGNPYVTGYFYSGSNSSDYDYLTLKYDGRTGQTLWTSRYNGPDNSTDFALDIAVSSNNDVYVTGRSYGPNQSDYATLKYDGRTGEQLWASRYNGPANADDLVTSLSLDAAGNAFVTGYSYNGQNYDFATVKYDRRTGQQLWASRFNGPADADDVPGQLLVNAAGDVYATGYSFNPDNTDYATVKYDGRTGQLAWVSRYNGPDNSFEGATGLALDAAGGVYVTGYSYNSTVTRDYATVKYDPRTGRQLWAARYDGPGGDTDVAVTLAVDQPGNVYVTGYSYGDSYYDYATVKYESRPGPDAFAPATGSVSSLEAYPNPAGAATALRFRLPAAGPGQVQVYNQFGAIVATQEVPAAPPTDAWQTLPLPTASLPNGVYLCRLRQGTATAQLRLQVQH